MVTQDVENLKNYVNDVIRLNPNYSNITREIGALICRMYPKLDESQAYELTIPFVLDIAHSVEKYIKRKIPKELR